MSRRHFVAILVGIATAVLSQWGVSAGSRLIEVCCFSNARGSVWIEPALMALYNLGLLIPGLVAGWVAKTRGILVGFLAGVLGGIANSAATGIITWAHILSSRSQWLWLLGIGIALGIPCAIAGAAGQLLRSNYRIERTRER
jgi:MFS family permease